jgi:hypothetical protein
MNEISSSPPASSTVRLPAHASRWTPRRITALVIGSLLALVAVGFLGSGGWALWVDRSQRDGGYVTTPSHQFSTAGSALATKSTQLGSAGTGWLYAPGLLGNVRIRVTPASSGPVFVGIGPTGAVDRYLAGVGHTIITDYWSGRVEAVNGGTPRTAPGAQHFWVASTTGSGRQSVFWKPTHGSWTVVVMNANGRPGVSVGADLGARLSALPWIALGLLIAGAVFMTGGVLLILGAIRRHTTAS